MIPVEEAEMILKGVKSQPVIENVGLTDALGRVLAVDVVSTIYMPPFNKSAMDGYALAHDDMSAGYEVIETIAAGNVPQKKVGKGQCAKIMTGAMLPEGADQVIRVEVTEENNGVMKITGSDRNSNICYRGEDIKPGDRVLTAGHLLRPQEIGIMASLGLNCIDVFKHPVVGIITTGSEIIEPGQPLQYGQIYNSNAYSIGAQVKRAGATVIYAGIVLDSVKHIRDLINNLLGQAQMILISGGVSMGDFDFVPGILKDLGVTLHFDQVAIQPGKPTVFGTREDSLIFGMPGNPVSTFIVFEVFVRPVLSRLMGLEYIPVEIKGVMAREYKRKQSVRTAFIPVYINREGEVETIDYHGSAHLSALARANGLLKIPRGVDHLSGGSTVYVRQI